MTPVRPIQASIPSVDRILGYPPIKPMIDEHGREAVVAAIRDELEERRARLLGRAEAAVAETSVDHICDRVAARLRMAATASVKPVLNLTGTILHTNLGRALLPAEVVQAINVAATQAVSLEFDLTTGKRDDRDRHLEPALKRLTGAEKATVVNNNAAALLLVLNTLARRREVIVSRGELIEIGGEFRLPEIMKRAECKLVEVGTTNRTHLKDYAEAVGPRTALILKVHPSNFQVVGFTKSVGESELSGLAHERGLPLVCDLGAGALLDLRRWGLPYENTAAAMIGAGVDLVTFSGDKLLGGPQAGIIVGRSELLNRINRNALKRALRVDKLRVAALDALLRLHANPERLAERLPVLKCMVRSLFDIKAQAERILPAIANALAGIATVTVESCESQVGSGSLPLDRLPSYALAIRPAAIGRKERIRVEALAQALRALPVPVVGRVNDGVLYLDLRCLDDERNFLGQLGQLETIDRRGRSL